METKSKCEIHLCSIYRLGIYRFYLGYKNKLGTEFIYKHLHRYSTVFMSVRKKFRILEVFRFRIRDIQPVVAFQEGLCSIGRQREERGKEKTVSVYE
jgi:hypothetical protein